MAAKVAVLLLICGVASASPVTVHVVADKQPIANVVVAIGAYTYAVTDAHGEAQLEAPLTAIAWARVPDGYAPGPAWKAIDARTRDVTIQLHPRARSGPVKFAVLSDSHITGDQQFWKDLGGAVDEAVVDGLDFYTILGDVSQGSTDRDMGMVANQLAGAAAPFVPVAGNHDWYDGGGAYSRALGPDNYSFDIGRAHFVVWNMALKGDTLKQFLDAELARVDKTMTIIALAHAPPPREQLEMLRLAGVAYLFTGHNHANRTWDHGGMIELNTEPLLMAGIDFTPGGYRVVTLGDKLTSEHRTITDGPFVSLVAASCVRDVAFVAASVDAGTTSVTARIDCDGAPIVATPAGGWDFRVALPMLPSGAHSLAIEARSTSGRVVTRTATIQVCALPAARGGKDWPQLGGAPDHRGAVRNEIAPPLAARWVQATGGHLLSGPVVTNGVVYATVTDLADGNTGGVIALELATGKLLWRHATTGQLRGAPAVTNRVVAVAQVDATVLGLDAATGNELWRTPLGIDLPPQAASIFASMATDAGDFLVGDQNLWGVLDAASGTPLWTDNPVHEGVDSQSLAAIAISDDIAIGVFNRAIGGLAAWDRATGAPLWRINDARTTAINATPVIGDGLVYVVAGTDEVWAVELQTGAARWKIKLDQQGFDWGNATIGTPALAHGILLVPTLYRDVVALDASSGRELWRRAGLPSRLRATHYRGGHEAGFAASPVITGDLAYTVDTSGELAALELRTGRLLWHTPLGAPALAGLAVSGDYLIAASFDGTIHAFAPGVAPSGEPARCDARGCCDAGGQPSSLLIALGLALGCRRRSRRPARPS